MRPGWLPGLLIAGILAAPVFRVMLATQDNYSAYVLLPARMDGLLVGAFIAWLSLRQVFELRRASVSGAIISLFVVGVMLALYARFALGQGTGGVLLHSALSLTYGSALAGVLYWQDKSFTHHLLANRPARELAKISYMVYLTHQLFNGLAHGLLLGQTPQIHGLTDALVSALALLATLAFSWVSFRLFEGPIMRLGGRWQYRTKNLASA